MFNSAGIKLIVTLWARLALCALLGNFAAPLSALAQITPTHERPYFMPESERARIHDLVSHETWAQADFERLKERHRAGYGYASAFLYALERDATYLQPARDWLIDYGRKGGDLGKRGLEAEPDFFKGGQPWLGDVYYKIDLRPLIAYDWVYPGLTAEERATVEAGILASARFRMAAMDRWSQTPNLVFKPTVMVAAAGLVTGDPELLAWGFLRKPWSSRGGYLPVLNLMIQDGGPWGEAPIYPIAHKNLLLMAQMSRLLRLMDDQDWFARKMPSGGSPKTLMDYFIDTAYPLERTGFGPGQIRIATYGNGSTNAGGDLFLANPAGPGLDLHQELAEAYNVSQDPRYAAFLALLPGYQPNLIDRRPLGADAPYPPAPSKVWAHYGIAILRSDESPAYWTSEKAIAVFEIMSQGYGHEHLDKFAITLHGAGRLLYPDYNAVQYENLAVGWTLNSIAHNTVVVDEKDTRNTMPSGIRSDFRPGVKFLATSASEVFSEVKQTRALLLTRDYLLDVFHLTSALPHIYDYLLHSFGRPEPDHSERFAPTDALQKRYWRLEEPRGATRNDTWALDFVLDGPELRQRQVHDTAWLVETGKAKSDEEAKSQFHYGPTWYDHTAAVRITMAADPKTLAVYGRGPHGLGMLVARRVGRRDTAFVAVHEPFADDTPKVIGVSLLERSAEALVVRIDGRGFTDYAAVTLGPQMGEPEHVLAAAEDPATRFAFRSYGYLRIGSDGRAAAWGGWTGFRVPHVGAALAVNGRDAEAHTDGRYLVFGEVPAGTESPFAEDPESPLDVDISPAPVRVFQSDRRALSLKMTNTMDREISGKVAFALMPGLRVEPTTAEFGPLAPGTSDDLPVTVIAEGAALGRHTLLYRPSSPRTAGGNLTPTAARGLDVMVGPVLEFVYRHPEPAVYRVHAPKFTAEFDMFHGLCRYLADDDGTVRLDGAPLFTFSDGEHNLLSPLTDHAFTWPTESPAHLHARVYDVARYGVDFIGDRMVVQMDRDWTRPKAIRFTVPGEWRSPEGSPDWAATIASDGTEVTAMEKPIARTQAKISAAELAFPGSDRSLCFQFLPPQDVAFTTVGMTFIVDSTADNKWTIGFCPSSGLSGWRWRE